MENTYNAFCEFLSGLKTAELIEKFNDETGKPGWGTSRANYLSAMHSEFLKRDIDCAAFISGNEMSLAKKIKLVDNRILLSEE